MTFRLFTPILVAGALNIVFVSNSLGALQERIIKTMGDWEVVQMPPSASDPTGACVIRSTSHIKGGRRPRTEIRIKLAPLSVFLAPDKDLSGVMMALAVLENRSDRTLPKRMLEHQLSKDSGKTIRHEENPQNSGRWESTKNMADPAQFVREMSAGSKLIYQWKLDRSGKTHIFDLEGFGAMVKTVEASRVCNGKS